MTQAAAGMDVHIGLTDGVSHGLKTIQSGIIRFVGAITAATAAIAVAGYPIRNAVSYERALANIAKTTGFTERQINRLGKSLLDLSTRTSRSATELAEIATVAGQLGLGTRAGVQGIIDFTEVVGEAATALNILEEEAAKIGATIINIFKYEAGDARNILSVINELSNTSVARGEEIADVAARIGTIAGLAFPQVAALAAYSKDLGVSTEIAGTSFVKIFTRMLSSAENFSTLLQISVEEWITLIEEDAVGALQKAATAVSKLGSAAQASAINRLFGQGRVYAMTAKIVEDASNNFELLGHHIETANTQMSEGTSIGREFAAVMGTTEEQVKQTGNVITALATTSGQDTLPVIQKLLEDLRDWASDPVTQEFFLNLGEQLAGFVGWLVRAGKAIANLGLDWGAMAKIVMYFIGFFLLQWGVKIYAALARHLVGLGAVAKKWQELTKAVAAYGAAAKATLQMPVVAGAAAGASRVTVGAGSAAAVSTAALNSGLQQQTQHMAAASAQAANIVQHKQKQIAYQKELLALAHKDRVAATHSRMQAQRALNSALQKKNLSEQQVGGLRQQVLYAKQAESTARSGVATQSALVAGVSKVTSQQRTQVAQAKTIASQYSVWGGQLARTVPLTQRLGVALTGLGAAAKGFFLGAVLPSLALVGVFTAVTAAVGYLALKWSQLSNERKREAREVAATERARQEALSDSLDLANEYYESLQRPQPKPKQDAPFFDTEKNMESLRGLTIESLRANEAIKGFSNNIEEQSGSLSAHEAELARLIARNEELSKQFGFDGPVDATTLPDPMMAGPSFAASQEYNKNLQLIEQRKVLLEQATVASNELQKRLDAVRDRSDAINRNLLEMFARPTQADPAAITESVRQYELMLDTLVALFKELDELEAKAEFEIDLIDIDRVKEEIRLVQGYLKQAREDIVRPGALSTPQIPPEVEYAMTVVEQLSATNDELAKVNERRKELLQQGPTVPELELSRMAPWLKDRADTDEYEALNAQAEDLERQMKDLIKKAEQIAASGGVFGQMMLEALKGGADLTVVAEIVQLFREKQRKDEEYIASLTDAQKADLSVLQDAVRVREEELRLTAEIGAKELELKALREDEAKGFGGEFTKSQIAAVEEYIEKQKEARDGLRFWMQEAAKFSEGPEFKVNLDEIADADSEVMKTLRERFRMSSVEIENQRQLGIEYMAQYTALQLQKRTVEATAAELRYMAESARGFADNIGSWVANMKQQAASAGRELRDILAERDYDIIAKFTIDGINKELDDLEKEIDEKFKEKRQYAINYGTIYDVHAIDRQKKAEFDLRRGALEHNKMLEERNALLGKEQRLVDSIRSDLDQYNELVSSEDVEDQFQAMFLKDQINEGLQAYRILRNEMADARREVEGGQDVIFFDDAAMQGVEDRFQGLFAEFTASATRNSQIQADALQTMLDPFSNQVTTIDAALTDLQQKVAALGLPPEVLENWREFAQFLPGLGDAAQLLVDPINLLVEGVDKLGGGFDLSKIMEINPTAFLTAFRSAMDGAVRDVDKVEAGQWLTFQINENQKAEQQQQAKEWAALWQEQFDKLKETNKDKPVEVGVDVDLNTDPINPALRDFEQTQKPKLTVDVVPNMSGALNNARGGLIGAEENARGGPIKGPGTATSDSILSWLSNGEYVIDSWTTRFFGSKFFKGLQTMARGGFGRSMVGKLGFPAFARGGPVRMNLPQFPELANLAGAMGSGSTTVTASDTINVNFAVGKDSFALQGPRDQVKGFVNALKTTGRGIIK